MNYFNSDNHVRQQCAKIERMMNRKINPIKVKEMNNYLLSIYYPIKPKNISDEVFLRKLSIISAALLALVSTYSNSPNLSITG